MKCKNPNRSITTQHCPQARKRHPGRRKLAKCEQTGKRRFREQKDAKITLKAAWHLRAIAETNGLQSAWTVQREYYCDLCSGWHLTSLPD